MTEPELLPPTIDPKKTAIGIRQVSARNEASTRSVMTVRKHVVVTDEAVSDTGPIPSLGDKDPSHRDLALAR